MTVTADYFLNRRFKNSLAGEKFAFSGFRLGSLNWSFDGRFIGAVARCFGSLAALDGSLSGFNNGTKSNRDLDAETLGYSKRAGGFAARTLWTGVDDRIATADCSGGSRMCKRCFPNKKILRNSPCLPACKQKNIATRLRDTT